MKKENKKILRELMQFSDGLLQGMFAECTRCHNIAPMRPTRDYRKTFVCEDCRWKEAHPDGITVTYANGTSVKINDVSFGSIRTQKEKKNG